MVFRNLKSAVSPFIDETKFESAPPIGMAPLNSITFLLLSTAASAFVVVAPRPNVALAAHPAVMEARLAQPVMKAAAAKAAAPAL